MNNNAEIKVENDCVYLVKELDTSSIYKKYKDIERFTKCDIKVLENYINTQIKAIFYRNGINVNDKDTSTLKHAFDTLNRKGIRIEIQDLYENELYGCERLTKARGFSVVVEDNKYIQCGVMIKEIKV